MLGRQRGGGPRRVRPDPVPHTPTRRPRAHRRTIPRTIRPNLTRPSLTVDSNCNPSALPQLGKGDGFDFSAYRGDHEDSDDDGVADVYQPFEDFEDDSHLRKLTDGDSLQHQAIRRPPSSTDQGGDGDPDRNAGRSRERDSGDVSVYRIHKADPYQVVFDRSTGPRSGGLRGGG